MPSQTPPVSNPHYSEANGDYDALAYGVSANVTGSYHLDHEGWVGVTTYMGTEGEPQRSRREVLVAMSGITTATNGFAGGDPISN